MNWQTVFDVAKVSPWEGWLLPLAIPFFFALVVLIISKAPLGRRSVFENPAHSDSNSDDYEHLRPAVKVFGGVIVAIATCVIGFSFNHHWAALDYLKQAPQKQVEGVVSNFKPMPASGHQLEKFEVNGVPFKYSDFDLTNPGFRNTTSHGGPIKDGLPVRIWYKPAPQDYPEKANWISRLDTAAVGNQSF